MSHGERLNNTTCPVGTALVATSLAALIATAARDGDSRKTVSFSIFGTVPLFVG